MVVDRHDADSNHEFRLEGIGLLLGGGLLLAMLVGAFFVGRWVERSGDPSGVVSTDASGPLVQVTTREPDADATQGLTYFDSLDGGEKQQESSREMPSRQAAERDRKPPSRDQPAATTGGNYYVHVGALRDEGSAAELVDTLERQGYGVRLFSEREGQGMLYKIRVGGYAAEQEARDAAGSLRDSGYPGAWVIRADCVSVPSLVSPPQVWYVF